MLEWYVISLFLYFPQDKSEYFPAAISFTIFFILCVLTFRWILRVSKRQTIKAKELEDRIMNQVNQTDEKI
ncbi:hypothetical protein F7731_13085 [Cytobacillus depressus]|uniref:Uncharacterized protein n=1 Tax=Cytobacillus depressus TaxID=1602942 RepID=A0A6L3V9L4_9BACI|nr:hypothetical protein [Cytobacillus depressus]KAB2334705.1 hypothetical protein F7731_13085 [Cytobacillus depressus]